MKTLRDSLIITLLLFAALVIFVIIWRGAPNRSAQSAVRKKEPFTVPNAVRFASELKSSIVIPCIMDDVPNLDNLLKTIQEQTIQPTEIIVALSSVPAGYAIGELNKQLQTIKYLFSSFVIFNLLLYFPLIILFKKSFTEPKSASSIKL